MKKLMKNSILIVLALLGIYACSKSDDTPAAVIDTDEYYIDSSGKYVIQLGDEGYNVFKDGAPVEASNISNRGTSTLAGYQYNYRGICFLPPQWPRGNNNPTYPSLPKQPSKPGKKTITTNFQTLGGGYRVTPKPPFLGGSSYECYECLLSQIERNEFFLGVCNGSIFISGSVSEDPSFASIKQTLLGINFNPDQTAQFIQGITSTGTYTCTKR